MKLIRRLRPRPLALLLVTLCLSSPCAADELSEMRAEVRALRQSMQELKTITERQQAIIEKLSASNSGSSSTLTASASMAPPAGASSSRKAAQPFIPDIGVVADITGALSKSPEDEEGNDRLSVREVELVLGHDIDPYSRLDATITFSDYEAPDIEEAYVSFWDLPWETKARLGRFRPKIGKASSIHRDSLDTADEPLVVQRYFGVEGLFKTGAELSGFTPWSSEYVTQQLSGGILEGGAGEDAVTFGESGRKPTLYAHLSNFFELSDISNFELGGTYMLGSNNEDSQLESHVFGIDATYIRHITPINKLKLQTEAYFQSRDDAALGSDSEEESEYFDHPWGMYALADYRLNERWGLGARYDYVELVNNLTENPRDREQAFSGYFTFYQSEFARWRLQYQRALLADGLNDDRFFLQGTFAIGTHKHQIQ